jgi:small subunit ribosomal protein S17
MADEPDNETTDTPAPESAESVATPAAESSPAAESAAPEAAEASSEAEATETAPAAEAEPAAVETEPVAEAEPAAAAPTPAAPTPAAPKPPAEPVEQLAPKERRRRARLAKAPAARGPVSPEERHAERVAARQAKAVRRRAQRLKERAKAAERRAAAPAPVDLPPVHAPTEGTRKTRQGIVVSNKADKTITVRIDTARRHRRYEKIVRSSSTLHAHDEDNQANEGDVVRVIESRPLSRTKRWKLVDVLEKAR